MRKKCKRCGKSYNYAHAKCPECLCIDCQEEKEAQDILNEQNSNYWHDTCGSIERREK